MGGARRRARRCCGRRWRCSSRRRSSPGAASKTRCSCSLCFALAALTERLLAWPRAPLAPAVVGGRSRSTVDALAGTQLLVRSLLGPNPELGVRFYGIGNELKSGLAVLVLRRASPPRCIPPCGAASGEAMAAAGSCSRSIEGSARIGAGVGGVILVSAGTAVATVLLLPGA